MGKVYDGIDAHQREWIARQALFFVGTAPLAGDGHVNVSPKGPIGSLRVLDEHTVAYLDVIGSGAETIAHLRENGRIVVMLCAFDGPPRILRLHGRGEAVLPDDARFQDLLARCAFDDPAVPESRRSVIVVDVERIADSCGWGVPLYEYKGERTRLTEYAEAKGPEGLDQYKSRNNRRSIDGLDGLHTLPG